MHYSRNDLDSVEMLKIDATSQSSCWTKCQTPLPLKLSHHTTTVIDGNIYLTGGLTGDGHGSVSSQVFCGNVNNEGNDISWRQLPNMLNRRFSHVSFPYQNKLFVAGGRAEGKNTCEYYDPVTDKWTLLHHMLPLDRLYNANATLDCKGTVIITGGGLWSSKVLLFDFENGFRYAANFQTKEPHIENVALPLI